MQVPLIQIRQVFTKENKVGYFSNSPCIRNVRSVYLGCPEIPQPKVLIYSYPHFFILLCAQRDQPLLVHNYP